MADIDWTCISGVPSLGLLSAERTDIITSEICAER